MGANKTAMTQQNKNQETTTDMNNTEREEIEEEMEEETKEEMSTPSQLVQILEVPQPGAEQGTTALLVLFLNAQSILSRTDKLGCIAR